jgi:RHS repeat-associated protein
LRASKTVNGVTTHYVYDEQTVVGELRSDGTSSWYTPGPNGYISRTDVDNQGNVTNKEWFVYDGLGSCRAMVKPNAQGTDAVIVARYDYDVYGAVRTQSGSSSNKFKYVASIGHPTDEETGLIYMRARYYEPQTGRFVSEDPAKDGSGWYAYVEGNPVNRVDPTGKFLVEFVLTWLIDGETETFNVEADLQTGRVLTSRIERIFGTYNTRLQAIFRQTMGVTDDAISATIRIIDPSGATNAVYHVVWNPYTGEIIHEHLTWIFWWFW